MEKKYLNYIDSELKKISIKDFKYEGNRSSGEPIFAFEHIVSEDDSYCIVLNGIDDGKVEIQAETDYNSGGDEYIDKIVSFGSWKEAIEYLKNNIQKIVRKVEEKYEYHKNVKAKTARIAKRICASDCASEVKGFIGELAEIAKKTNELKDKFDVLRKSMWAVVDENDLASQKKLLEELNVKDAKLLDGFDYFRLDSLKNSLKIKISEKEPVSYKGFVIKVKRVSTYYFGYVIYKGNKKIYDSGDDGGWEKYDEVVQYAKDRIDNYFAAGKDMKATEIMKYLGISTAYYDVFAYEYSGDANPQKTRHRLEDSEHALQSLVDLMEKNGISDAGQITVVKKVQNEEWVNERYDSASYEIYKGWKIVLKIGNDTWEWGVR